MSSSQLTELQIVKAVTGFLEDDGYRVRHEVPNMGQTADMVATKGRWVTLIEAKKNSWRRAIEQCRAHHAVADYICVAIGTASVATELLAVSNHHGYGVIHYDPQTGGCRWVRRPQRNTDVWSAQRRYFATMMRKIAHVT